MVGKYRAELESTYKGYKSDSRLGCDGRIINTRYIGHRIVPEVRDEIRHTALPVTDADLSNLERLNPEMQKAVVEMTVDGPACNLAFGAADSVDEALQIISPQNVEYRFSSESHEWYTPEQYIEAVRSLLGEIDLDPASCERANQIVRAKTIFTCADDGLDQSWYGRVFCNPPYDVVGGESNAGRWAQKMIQQYHAGNITEGVLLVGNSTEKKWFQPLWDFVLCFTDHRIKFSNEEGIGAQPTHGNTFVYFGRQADCFRKFFTPFGAIVTRIP